MEFPILLYNKGSPEFHTATVHQILSLLKSHVEGDDEQLYAVALQIAAAEARRGRHGKAEELRSLVETGRIQNTSKSAPRLIRSSERSATHNAHKGLESVARITEPKTKLSDMVLLPEEEDIKNNPIERPAQAWNALTIVGYTEKTVIEEDHFSDCVTLVEAGVRSPFSCSSAEWDHAESAIKPELVLEAGNCGVQADHRIEPNIDSLSLLTTTPDFVIRPLTTFNMTSAASPLAARMGAQLLARYPELWLRHSQY
ncbi:MAG: hypothetical protein ACI9XK_003417 [Granulosicoccus sp.]